VIKKKKEGGRGEAMLWKQGASVRRTVRRQCTTAWLAIIVCYTISFSHSARPRALRLLVMWFLFFSFLHRLPKKLWVFFYIHILPSKTLSVFCMFLSVFLSPLTYHYLTIPPLPPYYLPVFSFLSFFHCLYSTLLCISQLPHDIFFT